MNAVAKQQNEEERWRSLRRRYLRLGASDSVWRFNRESRPDEPDQGWKLHVSANLLDACDVLEVVAPFLSGKDVQFKAPVTLLELSKINCGLHYGYQQIGKFITVYPRDNAEAVSIASDLDRLTADYSPVSVPFDEQLKPGSSVHYRYGAFHNRTLIDETGREFGIVFDAGGRAVPDDRFAAVPDWLPDPFSAIRTRDTNDRSGFGASPLAIRYKVFDALKQRGKGGTYRAVDTQTGHVCIVKQGRRNGEVDWNGADGADLAETEYNNLLELGIKTPLVPGVRDCFTIERNFYFVMERIDGESLDEMLRKRVRRLSSRRIVEISERIVAVIGELHAAGWVWGDCKPANLIVEPCGRIRPIDFEGSYRIGEAARFDWKTAGFASSGSSGTAEDLFALGAVIYFLVTGSLYDEAQPRSPGVTRRNVPADLLRLIERLLNGSIRSADEARHAIAAFTEGRHNPSNS